MHVEVGDREEQCSPASGNESAAASTSAVAFGSSPPLHPPREPIGPQLDAEDHDVQTRRRPAHRTGPVRIPAGLLEAPACRFVTKPLARPGGTQASAMP